MAEEHIAEASPYSWAFLYEEQLISVPDSCHQKGSGFAILQQALDDSTTSERAKEILKDLLGNKNVSDGTYDESSRLATTQLISLPTRSQLETLNPNEPMDDENIVQMAKEGHLSLLGSIVRVVRESISTPVSTEQVLKTCTLAIRPADVPAPFNSQDMIIAALVFLSSTHSSEYWTLPLIRPTQQHVELEKQSYELVQTPTEQQLQWLETAFLSSADKFLAREKFCPRLEESEQDMLLRKGVIPPSAMPQTAAAKRKATLAAKAAAASPTLSAIN
mmetsp:Transcript_20627/g.37491  ORF Transcript_20627/g.37491 Transcript_20627/m.37491 type:complete len:276 (+) Transcript_20627:82-909(+)